jgi:hypothetical protein
MPEILGPPHRPIHDLNHTRVIHYDNVIYFRVLTRRGAVSAAVNEPGPSRGRCAGSVSLAGMRRRRNVVLSAHWADEDGCLTWWLTGRVTARWWLLRDGVCAATLRSCGRRARRPMKGAEGAGTTVAARRGPGRDRTAAERADRRAGARRCWENGTTLPEKPSSATSLNPSPRCRSPWPARSPAPRPRSTWPAKHCRSSAAPGCAAKNHCASALGLPTRASRPILWCHA